MTREEAMSYIIPAIERTWNDKICKQIKDVLSKQPSEWERDHEVLKAYADGQESMKPCKDAISRQAAIDAITANCIWENEYQSRMKKAVEKLPPVSTEKAGRWIPVSEPPKEEGRYICDYGCCIDFGSYHDGHWYIQGAVAYMPLPQPYKGESEVSDADSN